MVNSSNTNFNPYPVFNGLVPKEGPKTIPLNLDFSLNNSILIDLMLNNQLGQIREVQTIYFDASNATATTFVTVDGSLQTMALPAKSCGYLPLLVPNPPKITFSNSSPSKVNIELLNVPMAAAVWPSTSSTPSFNPSTGALIVSDPILEASLGTLPLSTNNKAFATNDVLAPLYIGTRSSSAQFSTTTPVVIYTGAPGWVLTSLELWMDGNVTQTTSGNIGITVKSGTTSLFTAYAYVLTSPPTLATTTNFYKNNNLSLYARATNDALTLTASAALTTGTFWYVACYSPAGAQSIGV